MLEDKVKIINPRKSGIYLNLTPFNKKSPYLEPEIGFYFATQEELAYLVSTSKAFELGSLVIEKPETVAKEIEVKVTDNGMTQKDMLELLGKAPKAITGKVNKITNIEVVRELLAVAKKQEKTPVVVINAIEDRIEKLIDDAMMQGK